MSLEGKRRVCLNKRTIAFIFLSCLVCLAGCGEKTPPDDNTDGTGKGSETVIHEDTESLGNLFAGEWICEISSGGFEGYCLLQFSSDNEVAVKHGPLLPDGEQGEIYEHYIGSYEASPAVDSDLSSGTITFDLSVSWWIWELGEDPDEADMAFWNERWNINGRYSYETEGDGILHLRLIEGEALVRGEERKPVEDYSFYRQSSPDNDKTPVRQPSAVPSAPIDENMSDDELVEYLTSNVEKAREMIQDWGMAALVTGETIELADAGISRLVFLGTNHADQFAREITYAISETGAIYEYDPLDDSWYLVNSSE